MGKIGFPSRPAGGSRDLKTLHQAAVIELRALSPSSRSNVVFKNCIRGNQFFLLRFRKVYIRFRQKIAVGLI